MARRRSALKPPLAGILVLDLSRVLAGPLATMILADLGARVVKVEEPGRGDPTRGWGPPFAAGESAYFLAVNRNKESLTVDLKQRRGIALVRALSARADVLVENFPAGTMARLGLALPGLRRANRRLVTCSITGFGRRGPLVADPGYDLLVQAMAGLMSISGPPRGEPAKAGVALADVVTGLYAATGILAALAARAGDGRGQHVETSLFAAMLASLVNVGQSALVTGLEAQRYGNAHPSIVPYRTFAAADRHFVLAVGSDAQFTRLCEAVLGEPGLAADPRFRTNSGRVRHRAVLERRLAALLRQRPARHWIARCRRHGVPAGPVAGVREALRSEQARALGLVRTLAHPTAGSLPLVASALEIGGRPLRFQRPPPLLGQHTEALLVELGYGEERIAALRAGGVI